MIRFLVTTSSLTRKAFVLCCHRTSFHASTASVSEDYLTNLAHDSLSESQYLFLKKGEDYELSDAAQRYKAVKQILSIMRYLDFRCGKEFNYLHSNVWDGQD